MRKLLAVLSLVLILLAFVACSDDAGGSGNGNSSPSGMSAAEQKIFNKYGQDVFYFAELADIAASNAELVEEICGAEESGRAAIISMYSSFGLQITNASGTTVSFRLVEDGNTITVDITNVHIEPSKGLNDSISYDADISVSGKESHSAQVSLEIDLVNNTTTITQGRYKTIVFGTDSEALSNANNCLKEIMALDEGGEDSGSGPYNPYSPGPGQAWDGKDSIPYIDSVVLNHLTEGISKFKIKYVEYPVPGSDVTYNEYTYGQYLNNIAWATRRDYCDSEYDPEFEPLFVGAGIDRDPGHQMIIVYQDNAVSDYLCFEQDNDTGDWSFNMPFTYDEEEDWYDAYGTWLDNDEFRYFSYLLYPYSEIGKTYNGQYKKLSGTVEICGRTCDKYQYVNDTLYIDDEGLCLRWTVMDGKGKEQIKFTVTEFDTTVATPPFEGITDSLPDSWDY